MNISFGLYMREKEISSVLSPQKFIAASTAGIAFYQDTIEALHFQEEVQPLEYPITRRKKHPFFDQKYWRLYTIVRFLPLSTLSVCVSVFLSWPPHFHNFISQYKLKQTNFIKSWNIKKAECQKIEAFELW